MDRVSSKKQTMIGKEAVTANKSSWNSNVELHHQVFCKVLGVSHKQTDPKIFVSVCLHLLRLMWISQQALINQYAYPYMEKYKYNSLDRYTETLEIFSS